MPFAAPLPFVFFPSHELQPHLVGYSPLYERKANQCPYAHLHPTHTPSICCCWCSSPLSCRSPSSHDYPAANHFTRDFSCKNHKRSCIQPRSNPRWLLFCFPFPLPHNLHLYFVPIPLPLNYNYFSPHKSGMHNINCYCPCVSHLVFNPSSTLFSNAFFLLLFPSNQPRHITHHMLNATSSYHLLLLL